MKLHLATSRRMLCVTALGALVAGCSTSTARDDGPDARLAAAMGGPIVGLAGKCLDDNGNGTADGNRIQLWGCNGSDAQNWAYSKGQLVGPGGKCLDVQWGNQAAGTIVQLWTCNGTPAQQWILQGNAIVSSGGYCLDVTEWGTENGTQIQVWSCTGAANQRWSMSATPVDAGGATGASDGTNMAGGSGAVGGADGGNPGGGSGGETAGAAGSSAATPSGGRNFLIGVWNADKPDTPPFTSYSGFYPDFTVNNSYTGIDPSNHGFDLTSNKEYPAIVATSHVVANYNDFAAAASGAYDTLYTNYVSDVLAPAAGTIYAIRVDWEFNGNWYTWSPWLNDNSYGTPQVDPATWIGGFRHMVDAIRANPQTSKIKIAWGGGPGGAGSQSFDFYPGDAYVDLIMMDVYFDPQWDGPTAIDSWNKNVSQVDGNMNQISAFAKQHGKPLIIPEWADDYDGSNIPRMFQWAAANNVVAMAYWDDDSGTGKRIPSLLYGISNWQSSVGNTQYTGSYWSLLPLPAQKQAF